MAPPTLSRRASRRRWIEEELLDPIESRRFLRMGSLPKWINPDVSEDIIAPTELILRRLSESEQEAKSDNSELGQKSFSTPQVLRQDHFERTQSLNDLRIDGRPYSPPPDRSEIRIAPNPASPNDSIPSPTSLCKACQGININTLTNDGGYDHVMLSELRRTQSTCRMCHLIFSEIGLKMEDHTPDRYRIRISLLIGDDDAESFRDDHNTTVYSFDEPEFSILWLDAMDLQPWEPPEYYKTRYIYEASSDPEEFLAPRGSNPRSIRGASVHCFTEEHDPAKHLGMRWIRAIGNTTASSESFDVATGWLAKCLSSPEDSSSKTRSMPDDTRMYLHTRRSTDNLEMKKPHAFKEERPARLVQIEQDTLGHISACLVDGGDGSYQYAALSYCWGEQSQEVEQEWKLTELNHDSHYKEIIIDSLPPTVHDSILIAWKLGITYIWIDALCIIQDSASDWAQEAAKMGGIYFGSLITIAASASSSGKEGCFNLHSQRATDLEKFEDLISIEKILEDGRRSRLHILRRAAVAPEIYEDEIVNGPLSKRAWTFQEYVLPRRTLYYTSKQLMWECSHCRLSEDNFPQTQQVRPYPITDFEYELNTEYIASFWYVGAVEQYSRRHLTFGKDKLIAISALAKATHLNRPSDYVAGLWRDSLVMGLIWRRDAAGHKSKTFACPSWSWASQDSAVSYSLVSKELQAASHQEFAKDATRSECSDVRSGDDEDCSEGRCSKDSYCDKLSGDTPSDNEVAQPVPRIVEVKWKADPINPFGNVSDAYIELRTTIGVGIVLRDHFGEHTHHSKERDDSQALMIPYAKRTGMTDWWHASATMDDSGMIGRVAIALLREPGSAVQPLLLLHPPDLDADEFRRVGIAELDADNTWSYRKEHNEVTSEWVEKTIRLV